MIDLRQAFLEDVMADPDDDAPRLIFADWLEDNGDETRAEFIRVQCRLAFARTETSFYTVPNLEMEQLYRREQELLAKYQGRWTLDTLDVLPLVHRSPIIQLTAQDATRIGKWPSDDAMFRFRRGFVDEVSIGHEDWLVHAGAILRAAPVRVVRVGLYPIAQIGTDYILNQMLPMLQALGKTTLRKLIVPMTAHQPIVRSVAATIRAALPDVDIVPLNR